MLNFFLPFLDRAVATCQMNDTCLVVGSTQSSRSAFSSTLPQI